MHLTCSRNCNVSISVPSSSPAQRLEVTALKHLSAGTMLNVPHFSFNPDKFTKARASVLQIRTMMYQKFRNLPKVIQ